MRREVAIPFITIVLFALTNLCFSAQTTVIYVDDDALGANNGASWADAYAYLQDALADANTAPKPVEIRVAQGIYKPDQGAGITPGDRCATFRLLNGVTIQGGYAGLGQPDPDVRDLALYETILSGDLHGNDEGEGTFLELKQDDSSLLVYSNNNDETAIIDGFTITHSFTNMDGCPEFGLYSGAILIVSGGPRVLNCQFKDNTSPGWPITIYKGGWPEFSGCVFDMQPCGMYYSENECSLTFNNCIFRGNPERRDDDCVILWVGGNFTFTDCIFEDSNTGIGQHALFEEATFSLTRCQFRRNHYGMMLYTTTITLSDCVFEQNDRGVSTNGDLIMEDCVFTDHDDTAVTIAPPDENYILKASRCTFQRNSGFVAAAIEGMHSSSLFISDCIFTANSCRAKGSVIQGFGYCDLKNCAFIANIVPCVESINEIHNCVFAGNATNQSGGVIKGTSEYSVIDHCTFVGNVAGNRANAIYRSAISAAGKVKNCIYWGNVSDKMYEMPEKLMVSYCDIQDGWTGEGNIDVDPCFAEMGYWDANDTPEDPNDDYWVDGDYHLMSQAGRWDDQSQSWVQDEMTSPCIDAGDPDSLIGTEPFPNGGRVNMGAYGAGSEASETYFGGSVCETVIAGDINGDCVVDCKDFTIMSSHWLAQGSDFQNVPPTVTILEPVDDAQFDWHDPVIYRAQAFDSDGEISSVAVMGECKVEGGTYGLNRKMEKVANGWEKQLSWSSGSPRHCYWVIWIMATDDDGATGISEKITIFVD